MNNDKKKIIKDKFRDWGVFLMEEEESEFWSIINDLIKEACKGQRLICAKLVVNTAPADNSEICMNAPSLMDKARV